MRFFRGFDIGRALLALALATALWWLISAEQNPERTEVFPTPISVEVVNAPPSLVLTGEVPSVQAQVRAPFDVWGRLRASSFRATVDAARAAAGSNELPVELQPLDPGVRSAEPVPHRVTVVMEERVERTVPVRVAVTGAVPFGYSSGQPRAAIDRTIVSGPSSAVQRVVEALAEIPLDQLTLTVNSTYQLVPVNDRREPVENVRLTPASTTVEIPVSQQVSYKEVGIRPVIRGRLAAGYYLEPVEVNPPSTTIVGEPAQLSGVSFVETEPIDVGGLSATSVRQVFLRAPAGLTFLQNRPVNVTLRVNPIPIVQTLQVTPTTSNLPAGLQVAETLGPIELSLSGPAPTLQNLTARDFRVVLDLAGLGPGRHRLTPQVDLPSAIRLESLSPPSVDVTLMPQPTPAPTPGS